MLPVDTAAKRANSTQFSRVLAIFLALICLSLAFGLGRMQVFKTRQNSFPISSPGFAIQNTNIEFRISGVEPLQATDPNLNDVIGIFVLITVSIALVGGFAFYYYRSQFLIPLKRLTETVRQFVDGDWGKRAMLTNCGEIDQLASYFNRMADAIQEVYQSLELQIQTGTDHIHRSSEIARIASSSTNPQQLLQDTCQMIVAGFGYLFAGIYTLEDAGQTAVLKTNYSKNGIQPRCLECRVSVNAETMLGWVIALKQPLIETDLPGNRQDPQRSDLQPESKSEAYLPITVDGQVYGVLNVQADSSEAFSELEITELQALINQISPALNSFHLLEATQINLRETNLLYQASRDIAQAETESQVFQIARQTISRTPYAALLMIVETDRFQPIPLSLTIEEFLLERPEDISEIAPALVEPLLTRPMILESPIPKHFPEALKDLVLPFNWETAAYLPVHRSGRLATLLVLGIQPNTFSYQNMFSIPSLQPFINLAELITTTLEKIQALQSTRQQLNELQTLDRISQSISSETNLDRLYEMLHQQINQVMGEVNFCCAVYDAMTNLVSIPYMVEGDQMLEIAPFPLGEGLTSILIRTGKPLFLVEDVEQQAIALGAKVVGKLAKSWLGVPLLIGNEAVGAMIVQDVDQEGRFTEDNLRFMTTLSAQVAVVVRNANLLDRASKNAERQHNVVEISNRIRRSIDIETILKNTALEMGSLFNARRVKVELKLDELSPALPKSDDTLPR